MGDGFVAVTYSSASTSAATSTTASTSSSTLAWTTTGLGTRSTFTTACGAFGVSLRLAGKLNGYLAIKDGLSVQFGDGTFSLSWSREVDECISDRTSSTWVGWDRYRLTECIVSETVLSKYRKRDVHKEVLEEGL